jgi:hypothetical protein
VGERGEIGDPAPEAEQGAEHAEEDGVRDQDPGQHRGRRTDAEECGGEGGNDQYGGEEGAAAHPIRAVRCCRAARPNGVESDGAASARPSLDGAA